MPTSYEEAMAAAFEDEMQKIAESKVSAMTPQTMKALGLVGAGALGYETIRKANQDRKIGRTVRLQQQQGY